MSSLAQHMNQVLQPVINEGRVARLYPEGELLMPIKTLVVSKEYISSLNEILEVLELIKNGVVMEPIIVNDTNLIIDGNKRYYAYLRLGYQKVAVIRQQNTGDAFGDNEFSILNIHSWQCTSFST